MASLDSIFTAIANAIRSKTGGTEKYTPEQMAEAIENLSSGSGGGGSSDIGELLANRTLDVLDFGNATELKPNSFTTVGAKKVVGNNITHIYPHALEYRSTSSSYDNPEPVLTEAVFPKASSIDAYAFATNHELLKVNISSKDLTSIPSSCFYYCIKLETVNMSDSITDIDYSAFDSCYELFLDSLPSSLVNIGSNAFYRCKKLNFSALPNGLKTIGSAAFRDCTELALSDLPESLTRIGDNAFNGCEKLLLTDLPESLTRIDRYAFDSCSNITISKFPKHITSFDEYVFENCVSIQRFELPNLDKISSIPRGLFSGCTGLSEVVIPSCYTKMNGSTFYNCTALKSIHLPNEIETIAYQDFYSTSIEQISLPSKLKNLNDRAFEQCSKLTAVRFHSTPSTVSRTSFYNCTALKDIYAPWAEGAVSNAPWGAQNATIHYGTVYPVSRIEIADNKKVLRNLASFDCSTLLSKYDSDDCPTDADAGSIAWSVSDTSGVSIDSASGVLTMASPAEGSIATITAVSESFGTFTTQLMFINQTITIDGHDGEWIDSGTQIDGNIVYKSDKNSYHKDNGKSVATINVNGYTKIVAYIRSYAESSYDYTEAAPIDTEATRGMNNSVQTTRSKQSNTQYYKAEYSIPDGGEHFIEIIYSKDGYSYNCDDRGYFYIASSECE